MTDCANCGTQRQQQDGRCLVCGAVAETEESKVDTAEAPPAPETTAAKRASRRKAE